MFVYICIPAEPNIKQHYDPNGTPLFFFTNLPNFHKSRTWSNKSQMSNLPFLMPRNQRLGCSGYFVTKAKPDKDSLFSTWQLNVQHGETGTLRSNRFILPVNQVRSESWRGQSSVHTWKHDYLSTEKQKRVFWTRISIFWEDKDDQKRIWEVMI